MDEGIELCPHGSDECEECDAYEAHCLAEEARMCPEWLALLAGYDDPVTRATGASRVIAETVMRHLLDCGYPWCREVAE